MPVLVPLRYVVYNVQISLFVRLRCLRTVHVRGRTVHLFAFTSVRKRFKSSVRRSSGDLLLSLFHFSVKGNKANQSIDCNCPRQTLLPNKSRGKSFPNVFVYYYCCYPRLLASFGGRACVAGRDLARFARNSDGVIFAILLLPIRCNDGVVVPPRPPRNPI